MNVETLLQDALRAYGDALPGHPDLVSATRRRARRRRTRHLVAGVAAVAVVAVVAAGAAVAIPRVVEGSGETGPALAAAPADFLPVSQFTPGWVPDGVAPDPHVWVDGSMDRPTSQLVHVAPDGNLEEFGRLRIDLAVYRSDPRTRDMLALPAGQGVEIRGEQGTLVTGELSYLVWTDRPGRWLVVTGGSGVNQADLFRYAEELVEQPLPATPPVTMAFVPAGAWVYTVDPSTVGVNVPGEGPPTFFLDVYVPGSAPWDISGTQGRQVEVGGRPAVLVADPQRDALGLMISFGPGVQVSIHPWKYGEESLLAFAEGLALTPYARPLDIDQPLPPWE